GDRRVRRLGHHDGRWRGGVGADLLGAAPSQAAGAERNAGKGQDRHAGHQGDDAGGGGDHAQRDRVHGQLHDQGLVGGALDACLGDQEAGGDGDDQGGHLADQAVADGHDGVGRGGLADGQLVLQHPDQDPADDVDRHDDQSGDGVAAHEFRGAVHGAEEGRFLLQLLAPALGLVLVDQARGQIAVDRHLLAGHGIQGEAGGDLGDPARTAGDDHEVDDHQDGKDDHPDDVVALHHQLAKGLDDVAGALGALMAVTQDQPGRGQIEAEPEEGGDQEHGWKGRELQGLLDHQGGHQDEDGAGDRKREQDVEQEGRNRQDQKDDDPDD